jgi:hypothetical protein
MRPYVSLPFNAAHLAYTLGISTKANLIDQKRNLIDILPGFKTVVKVIPQLINTTESFDGMAVSTRNCKLSTENEEFNLLNSYTKVGCEFECAVKRAVSVCKCMPWFYTNTFESTPICNGFSGYCFELFISDETNYKKCGDLCKEDCRGIPMTVVTTYVPINAVDLCKEGRFFKKHLIHSFRQHFAFKNYETLVTGDGQIPDLQASMANGSLCYHFVEKFIAMVSVESPTSTVAKSAREPRVTFMDQLGTIGGTLGLFTGMSLLSIIEILFFLYAFLKSCFKFETKELKDAVQVIILGIGKKEGRRSDDEIGNQESDEFMSDCSSDELKAKVKQNQEKIKQLEKKHDEEINDLKQLLLLLLPSDKKQMVQDHFDKRATSALAVKSTRNDDFSSHNENRTIQDDMNKDKVSYLLSCSFLFLKQCLDLKASLMKAD